MAQFYLSADNKINKRETTLAGSKKHGLFAHIRGWNIGVEINCVFNEITNRDEITIYKTGGSNNSASKLITTLTKD